MCLHSPEELLQGHAVVIAKVAEGSEGDAMLGGLDTADVQFQVKADVFLAILLTKISFRRCSFIIQITTIV